MSKLIEEKKTSLINEALDRFGTNLLAYAHQLCGSNTVDADALFDDLFIYAYQNSRRTSSFTMDITVLRFTSSSSMPGEKKKVV